MKADNQVAKARTAECKSYSYIQLFNVTMLWSI